MLFCNCLIVNFLQNFITRHIHNSVLKFRKKFKKMMPDTSNSPALTAGKDLSCECRFNVATIKKSGEGKAKKMKDVIFGR